MRLGLRSNTNKVYVNFPFDWTKLNYNNDIRNKCITEVKNREMSIQETDITD